MERPAVAVHNQPQESLLSDARQGIRRRWAMKQFSCHKLLIDFFLLCCLGIGIILFKFVLKEAYHRGFYCDDETIRYPYKPSTISTGLLMALSVPLPIITILLFEGNRLYREQTGDPYLTLPSSFSVGNRTVHRFLVRIYIFIGYFLAGACMSQMLTDIGKYSIGRLRPHFIDICRPKWEILNCTATGGFPNENYIDRPDAEICNGIPGLSEAERSHMFLESHLSFPSGHASFSFYCAMYTILYLESRVVWPLYRPLLRPILGFVYFALAFACSLSRISDYKHHWSDVLSGAILGTSIALITGFQVAKLFSRRETTYQLEGQDSLVLVRVPGDGDRPIALQPKQRPNYPEGPAPTADKTHL